MCIRDRPLISSVKLNGEEKCGEVGTGHNIDQYQTFSENIRNCIVKLNAEEKYGEVGTGHSIRDSVFCKDTQTSFGMLCMVWIYARWTGSPLLSTASKNSFCQDVRMWERMEKLAETMWEASQNQFLEKIA